MLAPRLPTSGRRGASSRIIQMNRSQSMKKLNSSGSYSARGGGSNNPSGSILGGGGDNDNENDENDPLRETIAEQGPSNVSNVNNAGSSNFDDGALSGLHAAVRYTLPRVTHNARYSGTIAAMFGYQQPTRAQTKSETCSFYTCATRREPTVGTNNARTEVICAGTSNGSVVLWRYPLSTRYAGAPPPENMMPPPLILGSHHAAVTSLAFYDDTILVTGSNDCNLCLWDVHLQYISTDAPGFREGSRCIQTVVAHESTISSVAVHGPWIVSAGSTDGTVKVWGCAPGREKLSFPFLVPLQVIVLESRITAMHCGELRAVEGVVADVIIATADGNITMFRSTEEALIATSTGATQKETISVLRLSKQVRTHFPDGTIPSVVSETDNKNNTGGGEGEGASNNSNNKKRKSMVTSGRRKSSHFSSQSNNANNSSLQQQQQQQQAQASQGTGQGQQTTTSGSISAIVPLSELNTVMTLGFSGNCFARDSLNFSVMNALSHPDVGFGTADPSNNVRFVHCAYDGKKEELLLMDSNGEMFVWSTKSARIVFRSGAIPGAFFAIPVGERGFWVIGRRDICLVRIQREAHRLEHPVHRERIIYVELAPPRSWWSLYLPGEKQKLFLEKNGNDNNDNSSTSANYRKSSLNNHHHQEEEKADGGYAKTQIEEITPWLVTASVDNTIAVWNCHMKCMHTMKEKRSEISCFTLLSTQPGFCVSGHEDGSLKVWALTSAASKSMKVQAALPALVSLTSQSATEMLSVPKSKRGGTSSSKPTTTTNTNINDNNDDDDKETHSNTTNTNATTTSATSYVSPSEAFSHDTSSNAFHFTAHSNTCSVVGEGLHRRNPFDLVRYEKHPHLFSASFDGTLAVWQMPCLGGTRIKCEARVKCSDSEIVSAVYDEVQYCYWVGTNHGEVTAWSLDDLKPFRRLVIPTPTSTSNINSNNSSSAIRPPPLLSFRDAFGNTTTTATTTGNTNIIDDGTRTNTFTQHQKHHDHQEDFFATSTNHFATFGASSPQNFRSSSVDVASSSASASTSFSSQLQQSAARRNTNASQYTNLHSGIAHNEAVTSIALDAHYVFTGSEDGTIRMWNGVTGELHHTLEYDNAGNKILHDIFHRHKQHKKSFSDKKSKTLKTTTTGSGDDDSDDDDDDDDFKIGKNAGDVHYMFVLPDTGQLVVGTRLGIISVFDQATGKATAIGTTNKSHSRLAQLGPAFEEQQRQEQHFRQQMKQRRLVMLATAASGSSSSTTTTPRGTSRSRSSGGRLMQSARGSSLLSHTSSSSAEKNNDNANETTKNTNTNTEGEAFDRVSARKKAAQIEDNFLEKISREICSLTMSSSKKELVAGLGNGSIVRLSLDALKKVPKNQNNTYNSNNAYSYSYSSSSKSDQHQDHHQHQKVQFADDEVFKAIYQEEEHQQQEEKVHHNEQEHDDDHEAKKVFDFLK